MNKLRFKKLLGFVNVIFITNRSLGYTFRICNTWFVIHFHLKHLHNNLQCCVKEFQQIVGRSCMRQVCTVSPCCWGVKVGKLAVKGIHSRHESTWRVWAVWTFRFLYNTPHMSLHSGDLCLIEYKEMKLSLNFLFATYLCYIQHYRNTDPLVLWAIWLSQRF